MQQFDFKTFGHDDRLDGRRDLLLEGIVPGTIGGFGRAEVDRRSSVGRDLSITPDQPVGAGDLPHHACRGLDFDDGGESAGPLSFRHSKESRRRPGSGSERSRTDGDDQSFPRSTSSPSRRRTNSLSTTALITRLLDPGGISRSTSKIACSPASGASEIQIQRGESSAAKHMDVETKIVSAVRMRCVVFIPRCYRMRADRAGSGLRIQFRRRRLATGRGLDCWTTGVLVAGLDLLDHHLDVLPGPPSDCSQLEPLQQPAGQRRHDAEPVEDDAVLVGDDGDRGASEVRQSSSIPAFGPRRPRR